MGKHSKPSWVFPVLRSGLYLSTAAAITVLSGGAPQAPHSQGAPPNPTVTHHATLAAYQTPARLVALRWALSQAGKPYEWGGTGPYGYDCSGLVMMAYEHAGIYLPRTTYEMLASPKLEWIPRSQARWGDLAFYGSGHVELYMGNDEVNWTFGAHDAGSVVSLITFGWGWSPTMYFRVV